MNLEQVYQYSQIILTVIAGLALIGGYIQLRTYKLFEIMKYIGAPENRAARRIVIREIEPKRGQKWWEDIPDADRLEQAAGTVCASYDVLARIIAYDKLDNFLGFGYGFFFIRHWSESIVRTHDALTDYLAERRKRAPDLYTGYSDLAVIARPYRDGS